LVPHPGDRDGKTMIDGFSDVLAIGVVIGAGLNAGIYYAFSTFVMKALGRLPSRDGIAAMQSINIEAPTAGFMLAFFGTAVLSIALAVSTFGRLAETEAIYQLVGTGLYLSVIVLTGVYHVPRNNELATLLPDSEAAANVWDVYLVRWTAWNHVRAFACVAGSTLVLFSLLIV